MLRVDAAIGRRAHEANDGHRIVVRRPVSGATAACNCMVGGYSAGLGPEFDTGRRHGEAADESGMLFSG